MFPRAERVLALNGWREQATQHMKLISTRLTGLLFVLYSLCYVICYVIWLFLKRLSQEGIQRRSQRDRLVKIKVFKLYGETPMISPGWFNYNYNYNYNYLQCNITLRSARTISETAGESPGKYPIRLVLFKNCSSLSSGEAL